eukprot:SAG11_NODE_33479_length_277_cov_0.584270_1_plen_28_part_01
MASKPPRNDVVIKEDSKTPSLATYEFWG